MVTNHSSSDRHRDQWEALGSNDPYWAVLADPRKTGGLWDKDKFFRKGDAELDYILRKAIDLGMSPRFDVALDYGCGVGRLSRALARYFERVFGVDISESMLAEARKRNASYSNIQFLKNNGDGLPHIADESIDFLYCNMVLQHSCRQIQRVLIKEFLRLVRPGGTLVFQTPSRAKLTTCRGLSHHLLGNRLMNVVRRIKHGSARVMEMHTMSKNEVFDLLSDTCASILEVERNNASGSSFVSYRYFVVKDETVVKQRG